MKIKIGAAQVGTCLFNPQATTTKLEDYLGQAKACELDLVVFPEAFIGGYPKGIDFGVAVGSRSPDGREEFRQYFEQAIERGSDQMQQIQSAIKTANLNVVLGLIERSGGTLYCVTASFDRNGACLAWHRKLCLLYTSPSPRD